MNLPAAPTLVALMLGSLVLSACGPGADSPEAREKQMEDYAAQHGLDLDVSVGADGKAVAITQQVGGNTVTTGQNLERPADFPDDVSLYPGLRILAVSDTPAGRMLQGQSDDDTAAVAAHLREQMKTQGWDDESLPATAGAPMTSLRFVKSRRTVSINLIGTGAQTQVQMLLQTGG